MPQKLGIFGQCQQVADNILDWLNECVLFLLAQMVNSP